MSTIATLIHLGFQSQRTCPIISPNLPKLELRLVSSSSTSILLFLELDNLLEVNISPLNIDQHSVDRVCRTTAVLVYDATLLNSAGMISRQCSSFNDSMGLYSTCHAMLVLF
jgi:hypothetical protein